MSEQTKIDNFICQNCGGTMKWNIAKQVFECAACRTPGNINTDGKIVVEHDFNGYARREETSVPFEKYDCIICKGCGANITIEETETATVCPMCGSSQVDSAKQLAGVPPDGIIPFKIDKPTAQENFKKWVKTRWFAPNRLKQAYQEGKLQGMYLPFWTYDANAEADYTGRGGRDVQEKDDEGKVQTRTEWYNVSGHVSGTYDDIQVCATTKNAGEVINDALPYNTSTGSLPYSNAYLSGFGAERYAVKADSGFEVAKKTIKSDMGSKAEQQIRVMGYEKAQVQSINIQYYNVSYKHLLLPAWLSAFGYSGKKYIYIINGETGKVGGQRPYSIPKILAAILAAMVAFAAGVFYFSDEELEITEACSTVNILYNREVSEESVPQASETSYALNLPLKWEI